MVSFQRKNPDFLLKNPDFLLKNPQFLLKTVDFIIKQEEMDWATGQVMSTYSGEYVMHKP